MRSSDYIFRKKSTWVEATFKFIQWKTTEVKKLLVLLYFSIFLTRKMVRLCDKSPYVNSHMFALCPNMNIVYRCSAKNETIDCLTKSRENNILSSLLRDLRTWLMLFFKLKCSYFFTFETWYNCLSRFSIFIIEFKEQKHTKRITILKKNFWFHLQKLF